MTELGRSEIINNRFEILFLYDVEEGNPNGDPLNENRPRIDEETGENIVTDVRLKRTVRDYFIGKYSGNGNRVFVRGERRDGNLKTREQLVREELSEEVENLGDVPKEEVKKILFNEFIDLRLFGLTLAVEDMVIGQPGPVQFKMGRSLHRVDTRYIQQSVTLPSKSGAEAGTFADRYNLPYSLIKFYGIVNENAAKDTALTGGDVHKLMEGMWNGTKSLITHSKIEHEPQMLLLVEYSGGNYHIGRLDGLLDYKSEKEDEAIRTIEDIDLNTNDLFSTLEENGDKIEEVHLKSKIPVDMPPGLDCTKLAF